MKRPAAPLTGSSESFKIGDITVSMKEILDKFRIKRVDIIEKDLKSKGTDEKNKLDVDLNLIFPLTKRVVYNMDQIFALLDLIDYEHVNNIQFDGETLWVSAK